MISEQEFIKLLQKRSIGNCTDEDIQLIDEYLKSRYGSDGADLMAGDLVSSTFDKITSAIDVFETKQLKRRSTLRIAIKVAAMVLLISSAGLLLRYKGAIYNYVNPLSYTNVEAKAGHNTTITLPDGSVVTLNQNSKLTYSDRFNDTLREVSLTGEAYFRVAKNKNKPFIVHTGELSTKVLGTSFNIEAYPFSKIIAVQLITGKVWLRSATTGKHNVNYILSPDQEVTYNKVSGLAEKHDVANAESYTAWKDGKIRFSDTRLDEVVRRLNITFRSKIILTDVTLATQTFYGQFGINEQPIDVVKAICVLVKAKYMVRPDGEIILYPGGTQQTEY